MSEDFWTPGRIEKVRTLWAKGDSAAAIGRQIGANKNQVIGKVRRLGLANRPSPITGIVGTRSPRKSRRVPKQTLPSMAAKPGAMPDALGRMRVPVRKKTTLAVSNAQPFEVPLNVLTLEVEPNQWVDARIPKRNALVWLGKLSGGTKTCQYPMTDARPWLMCDAPTVTGLSWCAEHRAVCFVRKEELTHAPRG
jgi:hypothetical protein